MHCTQSAPRGFQATTTCPRSVRVSVVEVATLAEALRLEGHGGSVVAAFFVSMRLAVACEDRAFYLWDITQARWARCHFLRLRNTTRPAAASDVD